VDGTWACPRARPEPSSPRYGSRSSRRICPRVGQHVRPSVGHRTNGRDRSATASTVVSRERNLRRSGSRLTSDEMKKKFDELSKKMADAQSGGRDWSVQGPKQPDVGKPPKASVIDRRGWVDRLRDAIRGRRGGGGGAQGGTRCWDPPPDPFGTGESPGRPEPWTTVLH
jgi:hypothetical protein